jgi:hypothetical protein
MKKEDEKYYQKLNADLSNLYKKIGADNVLKYNIDLENDVVIIILHNHLKLTVVFENQYKEAVIYFDSRNSQYTHWHLDNFDAISFLSDLMEDKKVFIESKLLRLIRSQFTFKILDLEKYLANKNRYFGKRSKNIFTASEVLQGSLKNVFEKTFSTKTIEQTETIRLLDKFVKQYNSMNDREYKEQFDTFFKINEQLIKLHQNGKVKIYAGDCLFSYFKSIIENDGPEYAAIIVFTVTGNEFYMTGVCVRGKPLLKKLKSDKKLKHSIKAMWGREGYYFEKS